MPWYTLIYNNLVTGKKEVGILIYPSAEYAQVIADNANQEPTSPDTYYTVAPYGVGNG